MFTRVIADLIENISMHKSLTFVCWLKCVNIKQKSGYLLINYFSDIKTPQMVKPAGFLHLSASLFPLKIIPKSLLYALHVNDGVCAYLWVFHPFRAPQKQPVPLFLDLHASWIVSLYRDYLSLNIRL